MTPSLNLLLEKHSQNQLFLTSRVTHQVTGNIAARAFIKGKTLVEAGVSVVSALAA